MNDTDAAIDTLHALREMGISVAIDDFGTGFSSLSYLRHLPIDKVKIDRSFINNTSHNSKDAAIVQGIVALAHHLELKVGRGGGDVTTAPATGGAVARCFSGLPVRSPYALQTAIPFKQLFPSNSYSLQTAIPFKQLCPSNSYATG